MDAGVMPIACFTHQQGDVKMDGVLASLGGTRAVEMRAAGIDVSPSDYGRDDAVGIDPLLP